MVSVKKKVDHDSILSVFKGKPLMCQLILKFLLLTIIVEVGIIILIYFQTKKITNEILTDSSNYIVQKVNFEMVNITNQMTQLLQSQIFNLGLLASEVMEAVNMVQETEYQTFFPVIQNPADFQWTVSPQSTDFSTSSFFSPLVSKGTILPNMYAILNLQRIVPFLMTDLLQSQIFRVSVIYVNNQIPDNSFIRVFPQQTLNPSIDLIATGIYSQYQGIRTLQTDYLNQNRILIYGPYNDDKKSCSPDCTILMSVSKIISTSVNEYYIAQVEFNLNIFSEIFLSHEYKSSVEFVVIYNSPSIKKIIQAPDYWNYSKNNPSRDFQNQNVQVQSGIDFETFQQLVVQKQQVIVQRNNKNGVMTNYLVNAVTFNTYFDIDGNLSYLDADVTNTPNYYCVFIYGEQQQMYEITEKISTLTYKQEYTTIMICIMSGFITITLITVFTYRVSAKLARPLKGLIKMAKRLNNNTMHKKSVMDQTKKEIEDLLSQSEYQVKELIQSFKELINNIEKRNNKNKSSERQRSIEYPLNQYEQSFVEKAKGRSDIIWKTYSKFIENEPKFSKKDTKK
ncbi:transmembrane protein, putative (macronuclear) [Tetrahymena thermophila SB210]|uniref:Transmembrane protein, putative n=1 Tax=Tetrahymena thermophila (strain SB210) TaxID=312017 RepID=I7LT93_TETTS|nr:transmembrane protein, putative [Tetrahymena thermophila SB210]EAR84828.2 transmembrane protein, putative [Tetrahymena thermophila SB210]|eukprot:XP_001032491.2 transmembrane protein, putative [Tetrahymena thermophila SB210]